MGSADAGPDAVVGLVDEPTTDLAAASEALAVVNGEATVLVAER
jgi:hypothetical protein